MLTIAENKDLSMWGEMIKAGGADVAFSTDKTKVTMLAPSNEAVTAFTKSMGYTFEDLKKNHALVDTIIAYHTILGTVAGERTSSMHTHTGAQAACMPGGLAAVHADVLLHVHAIAHMCTRCVCCRPQGAVC